MANTYLSKLLPNTWYFIVFAGILGFGAGYFLQQVYEVDLSGFSLVLALYSIGIVWAGLVVGFQMKKSK